MKRKLLAIILAVMVALTMMPAMSYASTSTGTINVKLTQNYGTAQKVLDGINKQRKKRGLSAVKLDQSLTNSAIQRAAEVSVYIPKTSPHMRPNGKRASTINKKYYGECCLETYSSSASEAVSDWMHSAPHKKTITTKGLKSVGIACAKINGYDEYGGPFYVFVLDFSKSRVGTKVTSESKKTYNKKVTMLNSYMKNCHLTMYEAYSEEDDYDDYYYDDEYYEGNGFLPGSEKTMEVAMYSKYTYNYYNTVINPSSFTWTSSDTSVATVDSTGKVTAVAPGKAKITAKLKNGTRKTCSKTVTVE